MLSEFFVSPARIRAIRGGPSAPRIEDFANHLYQSGYAKISARRHIRSAEHIVHWATRVIRMLTPSNCFLSSRANV